MPELIKANLDLRAAKLRLNRILDERWLDVPEMLVTLREIEAAYDAIQAAYLKPL